jgi:4-diphosphocytidyl-2C-methyl-D-erythritol kinase
MFNRLEEAAFAAHPELAALKGKLQDGHVMGCLLSGSGATVYALLRPETAAGQAAELTHTISGVRIISCGPAPASTHP